MNSKIYNENSSAIIPTNRRLDASELSLSNAEVPNPAYSLTISQSNSLSRRILVEGINASQRSSIDSRQSNYRYPINRSVNNQRCDNHPSSQYSESRNASIENNLITNYGALHGIIGASYDGNNRQWSYDVVNELNPVVIRNSPNLIVSLRNNEEDRTDQNYHQAYHESLIELKIIYFF